MKEDEYKERMRDVELFNLAYREDGSVGELLIAKWHEYIYNELHGILKDKYVVDNLIGDVWGLLYSRRLSDVKNDIMNKGFSRVFREIAKCVANGYLRDWSDGIGAIYGKMELGEDRT